MNLLDNLLDKNKKWSDSIKEKDPEFFLRLSNQQNPKYLWIGCSDSRVPVNQIVGLLPGEIFVHRNIANQIIHSDLNCLSIISFAVEILKIKNIIICGHYDCGGIKAAINNKSNELVCNWLMHIKDTFRLHKDIIDNYNNDQSKIDKLCELNVYEQVIKICENNIIQQNWKQNNNITIYGLIYNTKDGLLNKLINGINNNDQLNDLLKQVKNIFNN